jgi:hypothetical protein
LRGAGLGAASALSGGYRLSFAVGAVLAIAATILAATVLGTGATPRAATGR